MKIGIDVREFKKGVYTGLRTILEGFLRHAGGGHELVFFGNQDTDFDMLPAEGKKVELREKCTLFWDQVVLPLALKREKVDVFYSPYIKTPLARVCPYVNTIADVIPLKAPRFKGAKAVLEKIYFYLYSLFCGRRAARVITLSETVRERIGQMFGLDASRIEAVYPSVEPPAVEGDERKRDELIVKHFGLQEPYILYTGNFKKHKNVGRLISAYCSLPGDLLERYRLMLVGGSEREVDEISRFAAARGLAGRIIPVANVSHDDIWTFMRHASLFVFPSLDEGFGIPPVEAMSVGTPVAASGIAPMTEVLGEAALFFDPFKAGDIAEKMQALIKDDGLRRRCAEKGRERARAFDPAGMSARLLGAIATSGAERTLCASSELPPVVGGIATQVFNLWKRLPSDKILVLTARTGKGGYPAGGMEVVRERYPLGGDIFSRGARAALVIWHMWRQNSVRRIKKNHCAQVMSAGLGGLLMKKTKGTPYVVYVYSADLLEFSAHPLTGRALRSVLAGCERVIVNSRFTADILGRKGLAGKEKITVLTPGVDTERFSPDAGPGRVMEKLGIKKEAEVLLTVARLAERKGHDRVIEALAELSGERPELVYVIVGEGPTRERLRKLAGDLGVSDRVYFAGEVRDDELVHFYNACDVFIMLPRHIEEAGDVEGFGTAFIEAGACGKPVIAGKSGGVAEAVSDGETGILVDPEDTAGIKEAVIRLLGDNEFAAELGRNGLKRAREDFSWDERARELEKYI